MTLRSIFCYNFGFFIPHPMLPSGSFSTNLLDWRDVGLPFDLREFNDYNIISVELALDLLLFTCAALPKVGKGQFFLLSLISSTTVRIGETPSEPFAT